ncbi:uncharacterized protein UV8b_03265 [Ustilaginoidea virens]|uniref:BZIP domain-containing protein n=1 Tax=Ustilaginoidea virens TaxID=1159556 RepID=A0A063BSN9_USTVR|nr:uncharacterized protein UV8b_03265 [Ustilaginoidea virens]QUC19024.1 hypothetical protein UV8b_03265 [Ustilaginoidea virens]GAO18826.1 hypothetical protein UVI_02029930 [Ustilaginoidea virens]
MVDKVIPRRQGRGQPLPQPTTKLPPRKQAKTEEEKEQRRIERILRNRRAAQMFRDRKKSELEAAEKRNQELESLLLDAQTSKKQLAEEVSRLQQRAIQAADSLIHSDAASDKSNASPRPSFAPETANRYKNNNSNRNSNSSNNSSSSKSNNNASSVPEPPSDLATPKSCFGSDSESSHPPKLNDWLRSLDGSSSYEPLPSKACPPTTTSLEYTTSEMPYMLTDSKDDWYGTPPAKIPRPASDLHEAPFVYGLDDAPVTRVTDSRTCSYADPMCVNYDLASDMPTPATELSYFDWDRLFNDPADAPLVHPASLESSPYPSHPHPHPHHNYSHGHNPNPPYRTASYPSPHHLSSQMHNHSEQALWMKDRGYGYPHGYSSIVDDSMRHSQCYECWPSYRGERRP